MKLLITTLFLIVCFAVASTAQITVTQDFLDDANGAFRELPALRTAVTALQGQVKAEQEAKESNALLAKSEALFIDLLKTDNADLRKLKCDTTTILWVIKKKKLSINETGPPQKGISSLRSDTAHHRICHVLSFHLCVGLNSSGTYRKRGPMMDGNANPVTVEQSIDLIKQWMVILSLVGGGLFSLVGGGAATLWLLKFCTARFVKTKDRKRDISDINQGKVIDQDTNAFNSMEKRLDRLTERFDELQEKYAALMADNAGVKKEAEMVREERDRLRERVTELTNHVRQAERTVADLRRELDILKLRVDGSATLDVRLVDGEKGDI
jgi:hypothetical protein